MQAASERYGNGKLVYRLGYILVLILFTGLRLAEASGLRWSDVNFHKRTIDITNTLMLVKNRSEDESKTSYVFYEGPPKSSSSVRTIPLNDTAFNALRELYKITGKMKYVVSSKKGKPLYPRNITRMHDNILARAKLKHVSIHALRHTFASQLFAKAADVKVISKLLGHSEVNITYNIYIHFINEEINVSEAMARLDSIPREVLFEEGLLNGA